MKMEPIFHVSEPTTFSAHEEPFRKLGFPFKSRNDLSLLRVFNFGGCRETV